MKKYLLIFALVLPFVFTACSDDDEDLDGTVWQSYEDEDGYKETITLYFSKSTFKSISYSEEDVNGDGVIDESEKETDEFSGTYSYKDQVVTFTYGKESMKATVSGNKMTTEKDEEGYYTVFTKK